METSTNKNMIILIGVFVLALLIAFVGIVLVFIRFAGLDLSTADSNNEYGNVAGVSTEKSTETEGTLVTVIDEPNSKETNDQIDYNFDLSLSTGIKDELISDALNEQVKLVAVPVSNHLATITIDAIGVKAPIIGGYNGDEAIDQGWWLYPASKDDGEKILLAHRRYWQPGHPYSAWNINSLSTGTALVLTDKDGSVYNYSVISQAVRAGDDLSIFRPADEDILKIVTCSTWTGEAGSADFRYVTIAKRID